MGQDFDDDVRIILFVTTKNDQDIDEEKIIKLNPKGVILSGGPNSVTDSYTPRVPQVIFDLNIPVITDEAIVPVPINPKFMNLII